jgi:hypothetical protein
MAGQCIILQRLNALIDSGIRFGMVDPPEISTPYKTVGRYVYDRITENQARIALNKLRRFGKASESGSKNSPRPRKGGRPKKGTMSIDARLLDVYLKNPERKEMGARELSEILGCARSTVQDCKVFKANEAARRMAKAERRLKDAKRHR